MVIVKMVEIEDGAAFTILLAEARSEFVKIENETKERHFNKLNEFSLTELKAFKKANCLDLMIAEMKVLVPDMHYLVINISCHYISNYLHNECETLVSHYRRCLRKDKLIPSSDTELGETYK